MSEPPNDRRDDDAARDRKAVPEGRIVPLRRDPRARARRVRRRRSATVPVTPTRPRLTLTLRFSKRFMYTLQEVDTAESDEAREDAARRALAILQAPGVFTILHLVRGRKK